VSAKKQRVAAVSLLASTGLAAAKLVVGLLTGSLGVLAEAAHSLLDSVATAITWWAVRAADKPADEDHPWGHAKIENIAALAETVLLFLTAGFIAVEAVRRLLGEHIDVDASLAAVAVLLVAIAVDFWRSRALMRVARETHSAALEADALHFTSDMIASATVLLGLGGVALGYPQADALAALAVAGFISVAGYRLAARTVAVLVDAAPAGVADAIAAIAAAQPGIVRVTDAKVRPAGATLFVDLHVAVPRSLALEEVPALKERLAAAIRAEHPRADLTIVAGPAALDDETVLERVRVCAGRLGLMVHHVTVHHLDDRLAVALDLEVDGGMPLAAAHALADRLESTVEAELGAEVEVETHIEPLEATEHSGAAVAPELRIAIAGALVEAAETGGVLRGVHDVRARATADGLVVVFHARAEPTLSVRAVHDAVDEIERRLRAAYPDVVRIVGHAEPAETAADGAAR
jgi:cation diffusion facilitator family transporter